MFSIIIPLYNKELSIEDTINSVLRQTYKNFEVVVVNDGSTDKSSQIVSSIGDIRVRLINQENQGVSAARNRGIQEASYEWIAFLDGDDFWSEDHLEEIMEMMEKFPNESVYVTSYKRSDQVAEEVAADLGPSIYKVENYFKDAISRSLMWTSVVVARKSSIIDVGGFNCCLSRGEDLDLWARLARRYNIIKNLKATALYNVSDVDSLSKGKSDYYKSIVSIVDLDGMRAYERSYFKRMLLSRVKADIMSFDFFGAIRILIRHNLKLLF